VRGVDIGAGVPDGDFARILEALGRHGVLRFPDQTCERDAFVRFSLRFGDIQGPHAATPESARRSYETVGVLSNLKENGKYIGLPDAGQDWHTDLSYNDIIGFVNVLHGLRIPRRDGQPLGGTEFADSHAAYDALPDDLKARLAHARVVHDYEKLWEHMRVAKGSSRPALTDEQRRLRPPATHPIFLTHPITGRKVLYCNPGYATRIEGMDRAESDALLETLFAHQLRPEFRYTHRWTENDVLVWDHIGTIHRAIADYRPDEIRLMRRCQVMANKVLDPSYMASARAALAA
jgi:taurine dioxygenase